MTYQNKQIKDVNVKYILLSTNDQPCYMWSVILTDHVRNLILSTDHNYRHKCYASKTWGITGWKWC